MPMMVGDDDDTAPCARWSCGKPKLPTTLMAVRVHPIIETPPEIDNGSSSVPQSGDHPLLEDLWLDGLDLGMFSYVLLRSPPFSMVAGKWPQPE